MRIRTFSGPNTQTVMADIRAALGADAVILSTRHIKGGGCEIQAAVEAAPHRHNGGDGERIVQEADLERRLREDLLGVIRTETLRSRSAKRAAAVAANAESEAAANDEEVMVRQRRAEVREDGWVRTGTLGIVSRRIRAPGAITPDPRMFNGGANANRTGAQGEPVAEKTHTDRIARALDFHGVPKLLAADLRKAAGLMNAEDDISALAYALDMRITFDPIPALPRRPVMLIGTPGVGKTVTAAKLAARAVLLGRGVEIVSTDTLRAGAKEQMQNFTSILKEELVCIDSAPALEAHLAELKERDEKRPCIIDTPGTNPYSRSELTDLRKFVRALDVEPVLVVAAGADPGELSDMAHIFGTLGVQRMIVTRIDAARRLGSVLAAADSAKLNLAQFSMTPYVARGLSTLNPMSLSRLLLDEPGGGNPRTDELVDNEASNR
jgi:flagellar biosynthesis protein FlhF